jgi:4-hydroxymandelate oxidase
MTPTAAVPAQPGPVDFADLDATEREARRRLDPAVYDYLAGGAGDESTMAENLDAWRRIRLRPRVLRGSPSPATGTDVLGSRLATPIVVAPMGYQRLADPAGEAATAAAAASVGVAMAVSTYATTTMEEIARAGAGGTHWFQAYVLRDRGLTRELLARAARAGYAAVLLTADAVVPGDRRRDRRHRYRLPHDPSVGLAHFAAGPGLHAAYSARLEQELTPEMVAWVAEASGLPVAVKGILRGDDARVCVEAGARGVVVSNHGGRQSDAVVATATALPEVVDSVGGDADVLVDGGVRSGSDVVRALALGARAVLVGRPVLWALAAGGEQGVRGLLTHLTADTSRCLSHCGAAGVGAVDAGLVSTRSGRS